MSNEIKEIKDEALENVVGGGKGGKPTGGNGGSAVKTDKVLGGQSNCFVNEFVDGADVMTTPSVLHATARNEENIAHEEFYL